MIITWSIIIQHEPYMLLNGDSSVFPRFSATVSGPGNSSPQRTQRGKRRTRRCQTRSSRCQECSSWGRLNLRRAVRQVWRATSLFGGGHWVSNTGVCRCLEVFTGQNWKGPCFWMPAIVNRRYVVMFEGFLHSLLPPGLFQWLKLEIH